MTCASCAGIIEHAVGTEPGIIQVVVNLSLNRARVKYDTDKTGPRNIIAAIQDVK
jgi:Cu+-exporting ATPase